MFLFTVGLVSQGCSQSQEKKPSPYREESVKYFGSKLKVQYSSPSVRGRKIFGNGSEFLVPYNSIWRTGANEATVLSTDKDIKIGTNVLPQGKYALFTIPGEESWEIIINKQWDQWGANNRKESEDLIKLVVQPEKIEAIEEQMILHFSNNNLKFRWENTGWSIPIKSLE